MTPMRGASMAGNGVMERGGHRGDRLTVLMPALGGFVVVVLLAVSGLHHRYVSGDTVNLVKGSRKVIDCLGRGTFRRCGVTDRRDTLVYPYPLLQYLPATLMAWAGIADGAIVHGLSVINVATFAALLMVLWLAGRRLGRGAANLLVLAGVCGPLLFYAVASFGEMLSTLTVTLFIWVALARRSFLTGLLLAVACTGKETLFPFLFVLGLLCARDPEDGVLPRSTMTMALVVGAAVGVAVNSLFNEFRFGTIGNQTYLDPLYRTPGVRLPANFTVANWVAPNTGLLWFWAPAVLLIVAFLVAFAAGLRREREWRSWVPSVVLIATIVAFSLGLGIWYAPFGWFAYGPRLLVPLVPAFVLTAFHVGGGRLHSLLRACLKPVAGLLAVGAVCALALLPSVGSVWNWGPGNRREAATDRSCPVFLPTVQKDAGLYFHCVENAAWRLHSMVLPATAATGDPVAVAADVLLAGCAFVLLVQGRLETMRIEDDVPTERFELSLTTT